MRPFHTLLALLFTVPAVLALSPVRGAGKAERTPAPVGFEENKGQVRTTDGAPASFVRYRLEQGNAQLFLLENGIAYQFSRVQHPEGVTERGADIHNDQARLETFRMDMRLEGANPTARITTEGRSSDYTQYYNHDALDVHSYSKVIYHDVYPGIDWVVYTTEKGMKYDFVVRPGADPDQIRLRFEHHEELALDANGNLIHGNRMGRFTEEKPVSFQDGKEIATRFVLEGNLLRFALGSFDRSKTLTIDPARIWGTYYGSSGGGEEARGCATDANGNVYLAGSGLSSIGLADAGHQNTPGGVNDAFLVKFNSDGQRLWATYYGGSGNDYGLACAVDGSGNVYLAGNSNSTSAIASGGHQNSNAGSFDAYLVKFNSDGQRQWGTYYGGSNSDEGNACATDGMGSVYLAGHSQSTSGIASGGHQNTPGGAGDGFLVKFNSSGERQWGTYYGGAANDLPLSCAVDANANVYIAGQTQSTSAIAIGGHQVDYGGGINDCFLAKFNGAGVRQWGTYYGGALAETRGHCALDGGGNVYLAGGSQSIGAIAFEGHQNDYGGGPCDGFLVKFDGAGQRLWGTYYGGPLEDQGFSCAVDENGNVYMSGFAQSLTGIAAGGHQNTYGGGFTDAFLVKFNSTGQLAWGTYCGGESTEYNWSCAIGSDNSVFLAGRTQSVSGIAADGFQNTGGGTEDAFLVKFDGSDDGISTGSIAASLCAGSPVSVPFTVNGSFNAGNTFTAQLSDASGSFANPVDIGSLSGTTSGTIDATIPGGTASGTGYRIRVVASDPVTEGEDNGVDIAVTSPGSPCDDGDPTTNNDAYNAACECVGEPDCVLSNFIESEPNNVVAEADPLPVDTKIHGSMGACEPADNTMDVFLLSLSGAGGIRVEACMYNTGPEPLPVAFQLRTNAGSLVEAFTLQAGPDGEPVTSDHTINCNVLGEYQLRVLAPTTTYCTRYGVTWYQSQPVFAADIEPNNSLSTAIPTAYDTYQEGHLAFEGGSPYDFYDFTPPTDGVMTFEVQAEHAGPEADSLELVLWGIETWILPVGANGVPVTSTVSIPCRALTTEYTITLRSFACGTSYKWKYTMTPPVFANDVEPNNSTPGSPVMHGTYAEGHLEFTGGSPYDFYAITPPTNGVMTFEVQAEHVGAEADSLEVHLNGIETWIIPVGANGVPATSTFSIDCRGNTTTYTVRLLSFACGTSYRWKYMMSAPVFANDVEPNNNISGATAMDLDSGSQYGNIGFHGQNDADYYSFVHSGGPWNVTISAEHVGEDEGSITLDLINASGSNFGTFIVPVGGTSTALTSTFDLPTLAAGTYLFRISAVTCGVSYLIHCTNDADNDGICDVADLCPGGPEPGTPCDDGNAGTVNDAITEDCLCAGDISTSVNAADAVGDGSRIWPNPATDEVWFAVDAATTGPAMLIVRDLLGRSVASLGPITAQAPGQYVMNLGTLAQGTYVIELHVGQKQWSRRIVKA